MFFAEAEKPQFKNVLKWLAKKYLVAPAFQSLTNS
jgi:hypothetical protein